MNSDKFHVPFVTAVWMVTVPLVLWFLAGAGVGTIFDGLARFLKTFFGIFGGSSLFFGCVLLGWTAWNAFREARRAHADAA